MLSNLKILPSPENWKFWIAASFIIKGILFLFLLTTNNSLETQVDGFFGAATSDSYSYLDPLDNLLLHGEYTPDDRMPGFITVYLPLRILLDRVSAMNAQIIIQLLLAAISVYILSKSVFILTKNVKLFYIVYTFFILSTFSNLFDHFLLTESLSASCLIALFYFFISGNSQVKPTKMLLSGVLFTQLYFLKPVFAPAILILVLYIFHCHKIKLAWKLFSYFMIPVFCIQFTWMLKNYFTHEKIILFTPTMLLSSEPNYKTRHALIRFVQTWGGEYKWWIDNSNIEWYYGSDDGSPIPEKFYTDTFNQDSLKSIRKQVILLENNPILNTAEVDSINVLLETKIDNYSESIREKFPFQYYIVAPFIYTIKFMEYDHNYNFNKISITTLIKYAFVLIFYSTLFLAAIGIFVLLKHSRWKELILFGLIPTYIIFIYPIVLRFDETRYLVPVWPLIVVLASFSINSIFTTPPASNQKTSSTTTET